ncbi:MAG: pantoate--beta-alanine ligase [Deltaproteobacteria bacterium]|nr:pantoate--beta-alanine ligase [Deltaproteobacteria bacterium]
MEIIEKVSQMQRTSEALRASGYLIAFVPTMGFLHEGHIELMRTGKKHADKLVVSIFVNPTQFGPNEDFNQYPRDTEGDLDKSLSAGADIVLFPPVEEMYPEGFQTEVLVKELPDHLCGLSRPGHFDGVTTVVAKLFNIVKPHIAVFGRKDYQQLAVIRRMVKDLNMDLEIIDVGTVREADGLAMSSRNKYLNSEERKSALCLKKSMEMAEKMFKQGQRDARIIKKEMESLIRSHPFTDIDYISLCDPETLEEIHTSGTEVLVALAVRVGKTRLIDNCTLGQHDNSD